MLKRTHTLGSEIAWDLIGQKERNSQSESTSTLTVVNYLGTEHVTNPLKGRIKLPTIFMGAGDEE